MPVLLKIQDLNDNSPKFSQDTFYATVETISSDPSQMPQIIAEFGIQDKDMGIYGVSGINCFLMGDGAEKLA